MQATFIGTGDAFSRRYGHTNALVEAGDVRLMIDFGTLTPGRLEGFGHGLEEITHIAVSHIHADHVGGLEELAFLSRFVHQRQPRLLLPGELDKLLWELSLRGGLEMVADEEGEAEHCTLETYFAVTPLGGDWRQPRDGDWTDLGPLAVKPFRTDHVPGKESWGFVVRDTESDERMIFAGDTRDRVAQLLEEPLADEFARGPIFHDCLLAPGGAWSIHIPLDEIVYPPAVQERIVLVHYQDGVSVHLDAIQRAGLRIARPGRAIEMPDWRASLGQ